MLLSPRGWIRVFSSIVSCSTLSLWWQAILGLISGAEIVTSGFSGLQGGGAGIRNEGERDGEERADRLGVGVAALERLADSRWGGNMAACLLIRNWTRSLAGGSTEGPERWREHGEQRWREQGGGERWETQGEELWWTVHGEVWAEQDECMCGSMWLRVWRSCCILQGVVKSRLDWHSLDVGRLSWTFGLPCPGGGGGLKLGGDSIRACTSSWNGIRMCKIHIHFLEEPMKLNFL